MAADAGNNKVLRIGIIRDKKIVTERLVPAKETVTVGESAKNSFVLPKSHLPTAEFQLFKNGSEGYSLRFTEQMRGKVSTNGAVASLKKLRADSSVERAGDVWTVPLTDKDRGKVTIDGTTVLFQFVSPPPVQAVKSMQEMDFRPRLVEDDDPVFFGWLGLWSALGVLLAMYVWNTEPPVFELEEIPDRFTKMVIEEDTPEPEVDEPEDEPELEAEGAGAKKEEKAEKPEPKTEAEQAKRQEDARKEVLQQSKLLLKMIGTRGESSSTVANMWSDEDMGIGDLDEVLSEVGGVEIAGAEALRTGEGVEGTASDIGDLKGSGGGTSEGVGNAPAVTAKPRVDAGSGSMDMEEGDKTGVKAVVKRQAGQLRYCYESELKSNPSLEGRVEIGWYVEAGKATGVYIVANSTGSDGLANCIIRKIEKWKFDDSVEGDVSWPFAFRTQD